MKSIRTSTMSLQKEEEREEVLMPKLEKVIIVPKLDKTIILSSTSLLPSVSSKLEKAIQTKKEEKIRSISKRKLPTSTNSGVKCAKIKVENTIPSDATKKEMKREESVDDEKTLNLEFLLNVLGLREHCVNPLTYSQSNKFHKMISKFRTSLTKTKSLGKKVPLDKTAPFILESAKFDEDPTVMTIAGVDEAGRGPFAGPIVVCACTIERGVTLVKNVRDSKTFKKTQKDLAERAYLYEQLLKADKHSFRIIVRDVPDIDKYGVDKLNFMAMSQAIEESDASPDVIFIDGNIIPDELSSHKNIQAIPKGDSKSYVIAAASVVAKEHRDRLMREYHKQYPQYNWIENNGYGVPEHIRALKIHGITDLHRMSFLRIREGITTEGWKKTEADMERLQQWISERSKQYSEWPQEDEDETV
jgi:ribonuclease HII